ncbi:CheY-like chemotaxis protein [Sulfitobacter undariae]|uniref:CheY-like chemotaxis protein n=1 Tax=Sulfitobacter undariae TaxID=1563671 RepID=A0A7W6H2T4_9RHOB|nr:response regulator [Sulfitobacter undariae]MBB3995179.1 CheY-like chemotaxis protein [Sulfitobacter undariae]
MLNKIKILHVEDDADIREITEMSLSLNDKFDLVQCPGGQEALDVAVDYRPDVLLLDVMMPAMSGEVLLQKLRLLDGYADIPAIFMTARAQKTEQDTLIAAGAIKVIIKPFDPMTLSDQIIEVL